MNDYLNLVVIPNFHCGNAIIDMSKVAYVKKTTYGNRNTCGVTTTLFQFSKDKYIYTIPEFDLKRFINSLPDSSFVKEGGPLLLVFDVKGDPVLINFDMVSSISTISPDSKKGKRTIVNFDGDMAPLFISSDVPSVLRELRKDDVVLNVGVELETVEV